MKGYLCTHAFKVPLMKLVQPHRAPFVKPILGLGSGQPKGNNWFPERPAANRESCGCSGQQHVACIKETPPW